MFYVYTLTDPRDDAVFYVGKGMGGRMYSHAREVRAGLKSNPAKTQRIQSLLDEGFEPLPRIVAQYDDEQDALDHEADLIASLPGLTNIMAGGGLAMSREEATRRLAARQQLITERKMAADSKWLRAWLERVETWPGVVFPGLRDGEAKASQFVADVRQLLAA